MTELEHITEQTKTSSSSTVNSPTGDPNFASETLHPAILKAAADGSTGFILLLSTGVVAGVMVLSVTLLVYIFVVHSSNFEGMSIISTALLPYITGLSQALSTFMSRTVPFVISIWSYYVASEWLRTSKEASSPDRPSPLQLGLLLSVLQGSSIFPWASTSAHLARLTKSGKRQWISTPRLLIQSVVVLGILMFLSYSASGFDTWLHISTKSSFGESEGPYLGSGSTAFGKRINDTRCDYYARNATGDLGPNPDLLQLCGLLKSSPEIILGYHPFMDTSASSPEGSLTMSNASIYNLVVHTHDRHAILVPPDLPSGITFNATTIGIKSECRSLTRSCFNGSSTEISKSGAPIFTCSGPTRLLVNNIMLDENPLLDGPNFGAVDAESGAMAIASTTKYSFQMVQSNPFHVGDLQVSYIFDTPNQAYSWVGDAGFLYSTSELGVAYNLLYCDVYVRNVTYEYRHSTAPDSTQNSGPSFRTLKFEDADLRTTTLLATMIDTMLVGPAIATRSLGAALDADYIETYALVLSDVLMGASASVFENAPVVSLAALSSTLMCKVSLLPLFGLVAAALLLCVCTLMLTVMSLHGASSTPFTTAAQTYLTSPLALLRLIRNERHHETWEPKSLKALSRTDVDRVTIGIMSGRDHGQAFGMTYIGETSERKPVTRDSPQDSTLKKRYNLKIIVLAVASVLSTVAPMLCFVVYLFFMNTTERSGTKLKSSASLAVILTISQSLSSAMSLVGANAWAFVRQYMFRVSAIRHHRTRKTSSPAFVSTAVYTLGGLLLLSNLGAILDVWFHITTLPSVFSKNVPSADNNATLLGKTINETRCAYYASPEGGIAPALRDLCGLYVAEDTASIEVTAEAQRTWAGTSALNRIAITEDAEETAILVSAATPPNVSYVATTVGVQSTCESVTHRCFSFIPAADLVWATRNAPPLNCSGRPLINFNNTLLDGNVWTKTPFGIVDESGDIVDGIQTFAHDSVKSNPLSIFTIATSLGYAEDGHNHSYTTPSGFAYLPMNGWGLNPLYCNVSIRDVQYAYDGRSGTFRTLSYNLSTIRTTTLVMTGTDGWEIGLAISIAVTSKDPTESYVASYARQLSTILLSTSAPVFQPSQLQYMTFDKDVLGSQLEIIPLILFFLVSLAFTCTSCVISVQAIKSCRKSTYVSLAHFRLTSALPLVHQIFGPVDDALTLSQDGPSLFSIETEEDRLNVGPVETGEDGEFGFTIYKMLQGRPAPKWKHDSVSGISAVSDESSIKYLALSGSTPTLPAFPFEIRRRSVATGALGSS